MKNDSTNYRKINSNGVKKMCRNIFSLQQTLTSSITGSREMALDTAKQVTRDLLGAQDGR